MQEYAADHPVLVPGRLEDTKVAVLSVGSVDQSTSPSAGPCGTPGAPSSA